MDNLGLLFLAVVICYFFYKFWKKIIALIVLGTLFGVMIVVSSVNDFITDVKKIGSKQETSQTDMVYEDTITQQYVHTNIEVDSTKFDYEIDDSKKE
jgi:uncharacterized membrane protein YjgN (DUF898 family)